MFPINAPHRSTALWDMVQGPMPRGLLGVGDPDLHVIDGVPTMYLGGFSTTFRNRLYRARLAPGQALDSGRWVWDTDTRGRVRPLVQDPPRHGWDRAGMHTPSFVPGTDDHPPRLYYTGRASPQHYGNRSSYAIGVLEYRQGRWERRAEPVLVGSAPRKSVLEPLVIHDRGRYVMWFQANPNEIGPGELPDYELRVTESTESTDGIAWSPPQVFAGPQEGFFDNAVHRVGQRWVMVLARGSNLHNTPNFPHQGLWVITAPELVADRSEWTAPVRILDTDRADTPQWMGRGVYGPALHTLEGTEEAVLMYTAVRAAPTWAAFNLRRLLGGKRPVVPSPFYLAVGQSRLKTAPHSTDEEEG
ncbi:hypothetical protein [Nocardiopsis ganjiahuensis]|uniref:hypothetical protein n=1 Tax=Nocardiopsis ganjiahuensis TaxID=239984 RepID=UPI000344B1F4|nr:hypothetical protein [Nocardiopsis ganjiahuensis]